MTFQGYVVGSEPGYRLKLRRAQEHLDLIAREVGEFIKNELHSSIPQQMQPENRWTYVRWGRDIGPVPDYWGTHLGDFVHNVRSALDVIIWDLVLKNDEIPGYHTMFPICETEAQWRNEVEERCSNRGLPPTAGLSVPVLAVVQGLQPYKFGNLEAPKSPFMKLLRLSNTDKHRVLHVAAVHTYSRKVSVRVVPQDCFKIRDKRVAPPGTEIKPGAEIARLKIRMVRKPAPGVEVGVKFSAPIQASFSTPGNSSTVADIPDLFKIMSGAWVAVRQLERYGRLPHWSTPGPTDTPNSDWLTPPRV